jgi:hypothetical protein
MPGIAWNARCPATPTEMAADAMTLALPGPRGLPCEARRATGNGYFSRPLPEVSAPGGATASGSFVIVSKLAALAHCSRCVGLL